MLISFWALVPTGIGCSVITPKDGCSIMVPRPSLILVLRVCYELRIVSSRRLILLG